MSDEDETVWCEYCNRWINEPEYPYAWNCTAGGSEPWDDE